MGGSCCTFGHNLQCKALVLTWSNIYQKQGQHLLTSLATVDIGNIGSGHQIRKHLRPMKQSLQARRDCQKHQIQGH